MANDHEPCPFCGSRRVRVEDLGHDNGAHVHCDNCGADGPPKATWAEAIAAWDHREDPLKGDGRRRQ